jgi:hypothetical protein
VPEALQVLVDLLVNVTGLTDAPPVALAVVVPFTSRVAGEKMIVPIAWLDFFASKES